MGQVPQTTLTYGLVGDGRLGSHLARYFELEGISFVAWSRRASSRSPEETFSSSDVMLLAIRDSEIAGFVEAHPWLRQKILVHFSGALTLEGVRGYHPLMTFGRELYDLETYRSIAFVGDPGFADVFPRLKNAHHVIDPEMRPLYHSLCVMSGNFTVLLWQKLFSDLAGKLGVPPTAAVPYLRRIFGNIEKDPLNALTGPLQRGDLMTLKKNVAALEQEKDPYGEIYRAFVRAVSPELEKSMQREAVR